MCIIEDIEMAVTITCACSGAQSCPTLCDPVGCSPPGSSVHGISQARILEWVAIFFSRGSSRPRDRPYISYVSCIANRIFTTALPGKSTRVWWRTLIFQQLFAKGLLPWKTNAWAKYNIWKVKPYQGRLWPRPGSWAQMNSLRKAAWARLSETAS